MEVMLLVCGPISLSGVCISPRLDGFTLPFNVHVVLEPVLTMEQQVFTVSVDYCNVLCIGLLLSQKLQEVQNAGAILIARVKKYEHIT